MMDKVVAKDAPQNLEEAEQLEEFKSLTQDLVIKEKVDDYFYLKWLRARDFNLKKARAMLESYLEWRDTCDPEILSYTPPPVVAEECVFKITGTDNDGRPVLAILGGRINIRMLIKEGYKSAIVQYMHKFFETVYQSSEKHRKSNGGVTQVVVVLDMEGLTVSKVMYYDAIQLCILLAKIMEAYYPELLHRCFLINVTWVFSSLYNVVKPFLSAKTIDKIQVFSYDEKTWRPALLSGIPIESLPEEFGGTAERLIPKA